MIKKLVFIFIMLIIFFYLFKNITMIETALFLNFNEKNIEESKNLDVINKKKYLKECKLFNEKIDREIIDSERQCYYSCGEDDIVRVDTSIGFPCQPFILEER